MRRIALSILAGSALFSWQSAFAQKVFIDTVTITAPEPKAVEAGTPGRFEIQRSGPTNFGLSVFLRISGTASNGVDYQQIPTGVVIAPGSLTASIPITPIDDTPEDGAETVVLQIVPSPLLCPSPACGYIIGSPSNATVTISEESTPPPGVNIYATDPVATETDPRSSVPPDTATFTVRRSDGTNASIAVFYQISGTASNGVDYQQLSGQVSIPEGAWSADIVVTPIDDQIEEGPETVVLTLIPPCPPCLFATPPCEVPQGTNCYQIGPDNQAVAYIRDGSTNPPPATNLSIVTIFATDPIAVEGPFCWSNWWWTTSGSATGWKTNGFDWRTNHCSGSNTATFVVRRSGDTNSDLTVFYAIGGTASNGVDYVALPGEVTVPAGRRAASIEILPLEDNSPRRIQTVLLGLVPSPSVSTGGPPAYLIGSPSRAAAIILDNDQPRPPCRRLDDGMFHLCAPGTNGYGFCVRASTDLVNWTSLCTNIVTDGAVHFVDPDAADSDKRFYKVVPAPNYSPP